MNGLEPAEVRGQLLISDLVAGKADCLKQLNVLLDTTS